MLKIGCDLVSECLQWKLVKSFERIFSELFQLKINYMITKVYTQKETTDT